MAQRRTWSRAGERPRENLLDILLPLVIVGLSYALTRRYLIGPYLQAYLGGIHPRGFYFLQLAVYGAVLLLARMPGGMWLVRLPFQLWIPWVILYGWIGDWVWTSCIAGVIVMSFLLLSIIWRNRMRPDIAAPLSRDLIVVADEDRTEDYRAESHRLFKPSAIRRTPV